MCGIAGVLHFTPGRQADAKVLDAMTDRLSHRGPDGRGTHLDGPLGLGHRRLSIIDLSEDGRQPMSNEDGSIWVVLNGEIYDFQRLRDELIAKGHVFRSRTDTEVLVHLYEEEGEAMLERLRGMFAFALWDSARGRLFLARDRFGQKPLFYQLDEHGLRFSSSLVSLLADPEVSRTPDPIGIHLYLTFGFVPAPHTAFSGINKLLPGHTLTVERDGQSRLRRYWQLRLGPKLHVSDRASQRRLEEELLEKIDEATRLRMVSDVPLGAFLSGGVDSSAIVASMVEANTGPVRTFSIGFEEAEFDERVYAAEVARHLGTEHTDLVLRPDTAATLEEIAWHYGEPFADASALPTFAVSRLAREHVTVALSGDGADELFLGYHRYTATSREEILRASPSPLRRLARNRVALALLSRGGAPHLAAELGHAGIHRHANPVDLYCARLELCGEALRGELYGPGLASATRGNDPRALIRELAGASGGETLVERCAHADAQSYLPDDILVKVDVASMAYGLECRSPFLDHKLAEFAGRLPARVKMRRLVAKRILKRAIAGRVPPTVLKRRKMGFGVPLDHWFRGGFETLLRDRLLSPEARSRDLFRTETVTRLVEEHASGFRDWRNALYPLLMLETWFQTVIEGAEPVAAS
ncbi:MAG: asparagine synthase (glutamine-hydrolyzing) [Planctomycetes bacterium]|nr:asparagine synthase (glutamine-hydrolyzing) [Planctomycetota bacterium]